MRKVVISAVTLAAALAAPAQAALTQFDITSNAFTSRPHGPTVFGPVTLTWVGDTSTSTGYFAPPGGHGESVAVTAAMLTTPVGRFRIDAPDGAISHQFSSAGSYWQTPVGSVGWSSMPAGLGGYRFGDIESVRGADVWTPRSDAVYGSADFRENQSGTDITDEVLTFDVPGGPMSVRFRLNNDHFTQIELADGSLWDPRNVPIPGGIETLHDAITFSIGAAQPPLTAPVPEPGTLALAVSGLLALGIRRTNTTS